MTVNTVAYVAMAIHVCCKCMFQLFQTHVGSVLSGCCICCTGYTCMLQVYVSNVLAVSNVCCKCFVWICICCSDHTHMLQEYVCKCFICLGYMLQQMLLCCKCCMTRSGEVGVYGGSPLGRSGPHMHVGSEVCSACPICMCRRMRIATTGEARPTGAHGSIARTGAAAACQRSGRICLHVLWGPSRQSRKQRHSARVPPLAACI
jgi:hypothetical protein